MDGTPASKQLTADFDVFLYGTVFLDTIFMLVTDGAPGLPVLPAIGTEVWANGMGACPGGIANLAVAPSRLGPSTSLGAACGDLCWRTLKRQERVDLSKSHRFERWHTPVTVSMATAGERSMVTHGHDAPDRRTR